MIRHLDRAVTLGLAAMLFLAALPFGGVLPWAATALAVALAVALAALTASRWPVEGWNKVLRRAATALAALGAWGWLQSLHWPEAVAAAVSPRHVELWREGRALAGAAATGVPLSLAPEASRVAALACLAAAAAVLVGGFAGSLRLGRRAVCAAVLGGAFFQVLYGAPRWMLRKATIWGIETSAEPGRLRGTFVNPNHFALAMELALAVAFALWWWGVRRAGREIGAERRIALWILPGLVWSSLFAALVFSGSRAGLAAGVAATAVQGAALAASRRRWRLLPLGLGVALAGVVLVVALGARERQGRALAASASDVSLMARADAWRATVDLWQSFPLSGAGLGSFADAFTLVQPKDLGGTWAHAHNDVVELLAVAGPLGVVALVVAVAMLLRGMGRNLRAEGRRSEHRATALAGIGALVAAAIHELFDFGLTMPANALTLAVLCGAAAAVPAATPLPLEKAAAEPPAGTSG